jgi:hypothetical protein
MSATVADISKRMTIVWQSLAYVYMAVFSRSGNDCPPLKVHTLASTLSWQVHEIVWKRNGDAIVFKPIPGTNGTPYPATLHGRKLVESAGQKMSLKSLLNIPSEVRNELHRLIISASLSPDENTLMIGTSLKEGGLGVANRSYVDLRNGKMTTRSGLYGAWIWTPDSASWLGIGFDGRNDHLMLERYRLSTQSTEVLGDITDDLKLPMKKYINPILLRADQKDRLTVAFLKTDAGNRDVVNLAFLDCSQKPVKVTPFTVQLPASRIVEDMNLSRDGKRIAWYLYHSVQREDVFELWVSNVDGSGMNCLGCIPLVSYERSGINDDPEALTWKPDNKHITFIHRGKLLEVEDRKR